ncbi:hypothetical protein BJX99DRAFT_254664 [Aspergillus californicus]
MAPFVQYHTSAGQSTIIKFGGLLTTEFLEHSPGRCFLFRQTYRHDIEGSIPENLRKLINSPDKPKGPPLHFHQFQTEYFRVEKGVMGIEVDGLTRRITPDDGEISVKAGSLHRFFIHPDSEESMMVYLNASDSGSDYQLDRIQDGGNAYTSAPAWVPFRRHVGYWTCVIVGRWIGGLLGYKPFFREYTTDWGFAVAKMKGSFFQRRLVHEAFTIEKSWAQQAELETTAKPDNADFGKWTNDLSPIPLALGAVAYERGEFKGLGANGKGDGHGSSNGDATGVCGKTEQVRDLTRRRI